VSQSEPNAALSSPLPLVQRVLQHSAVRFCLVGLVNTAVGLGLIYACKFLLGFADIPANAVGYIIGLMVSFTLNSRWTFRYDGPVWPAVLRFVLTFVISYAANIVTVLFLIDGMGVNAYLAHAIAVVPYTTTFYLLSRFMVFASAARRAG
jgi:putative flippase GtrA